MERVFRMMCWVIFTMKYCLMVFKFFDFPLCLWLLFGCTLFVGCWGSAVRGGASDAVYTHHIFEFSLTAIDDSATYGKNE